jgi:glycosyltransferase involved in cell wall biosynthesis
MTSKVFLVMTVYNRQNYLPQALDSILGQTYPYWRLTIWDDGSIDDSVAIASKYAQQDPRIHFIPAPHTGRQHALKSAIASHTNYDYLAWIDSDDYIAPETLANTVAVLDQHPQAGMVYTNHWIVDEQGKILGLGARCQIPYSPNRLLIDFMTFHFRLIRREIYDLVGGIDLEFPQAQDYDICLKISEVTTIAHLPQPLYYYRTHPDTISQAQSKKQIERSSRAIRNALARRGLADLYRLDVIDGDRFQIIRRELSHPAAEQK